MDGSYCDWFVGAQLFHVVLAATSHILFLYLTHTLTVTLMSCTRKCGVVWCGVVVRLAMQVLAVLTNNNNSFNKSNMINYTNKREKKSLQDKDQLQKEQHQKNKNNKNSSKSQSKDCVGSSEGGGGGGREETDKEFKGENEVVKEVWRRRRRRQVIKESKQKIFNFSLRLYYCLWLLMCWTRYLLHWNMTSLLLFLLELTLSLTLSHTWLNCAAVSIITFSNQYILFQINILLCITQYSFSPKPKNIRIKKKKCDEWFNSN